MKTMLAAFAAIALIAVAANYGMPYAGFSAAERTTSDSVRLD